jgi:hypothetical protein
VNMFICVYFARKISAGSNILGLGEDWSVKFAHSVSSCVCISHLYGENLHLMSECEARDAKKTSRLILGAAGSAERLVNK